MKNKKALLVIDMQKGSFTSKTPRFDTKGVVNKINALAQLFKASDLPVIFIQHDGTKENEFIPSTEEWELLDTLEVVSNDIFIDKYANDVFYESKLQSTLTNLAINELYITGCATDFCVESTIQSALTKDYNITVVSDGHTTGERPHLEAEKVIEHYNWVWQNMIPTKGKIEVKSFKEVKNDI
ncbi:isochorismatase family protein [Aquimarina algiphila]|uniref:isochorismatase family protein n=1 Tax=Aquimarina algiphila TaxID=2047982 RepID=UPI0024938217|nr:isochorismatase family protein [Aquimarina algiphila]